MSDLTEEQWVYVQPYLGGRAATTCLGRPPRDDREVLDAILWILRTGASWADLPPRYPPRSTCWHRYTEWHRSGVIAAVLEALRAHLSETAGIDPLQVNVAAALPCCEHERCWQYQTGVLFLSPRVQRLLRHHNRNSS